MTSDLSRHERAGAATTTTPETLPLSPPHRGRTPAEINKEQAEQAEKDTRALQARQDAAHNLALAVSPSASTAAVSAVVDEAAFEQNLQEWGSGRGTPLAFNGMDGGFQTTGGEKVDVVDAVFVAYMNQLRREYIRFNGEGNPPTIIGMGAYDAGRFPEKHELPDRDETTWEKDRFSGQPTDPYQEQFRVPLGATDAGGEIYELTSRSPTSKNAFKRLIDQYGRHPQRRRGLLPLITLESGTYFNKKLGTDKPKPVYKIIGWVNPDGSAPAKNPDQITSGLDDFAKPFKDSIPF